MASVEQESRFPAATCFTSALPIIRLGFVAPVSSLRPPSPFLTDLTAGTSYNGFWQKYIPPRLVYQGLDQRALALLIERQKTIIQRWQKDNPNGDYKEADELRAFVVLGKQSIHRYYVMFSCCPDTKKLLNHDSYLFV